MLVVKTPGTGCRRKKIQRHGAKRRKCAARIYTENKIMIIDERPENDPDYVGASPWDSIQTRSKSPSFSRSSVSSQSPSRKRRKSKSKSKSKSRRKSKKGIKIVPPNKALPPVPSEPSTGPSTGLRRRGPTEPLERVPTGPHGEILPPRPKTRPPHKPTQSQSMNLQSDECKRLRSHSFESDTNNDIADSTNDGINHKTLMDGSARASNDSAQSTNESPRNKSSQMSFTHRINSQTGGSHVLQVLQSFESYQNTEKSSESGVPNENVGERFLRSKSVSHDVVHRSQMRVQSKSCSSSSTTQVSTVQLLTAKYEDFYQKKGIPLPSLPVKNAAHLPGLPPAVPSSECELEEKKETTKTTKTRSFKSIFPKLFSRIFRSRSEPSEPPKPESPGAETPSSTAACTPTSDSLCLDDDSDDLPPLVESLEFPKKCFAHSIKALQEQSSERSPLRLLSEQIVCDESYEHLQAIRKRNAATSNTLPTIVETAWQA